MSSYVIINIQTASPDIEIYAPSYTTTDILNEITIQSNVQLSLNGTQIYAIDVNGVRYDYTFQLEGDSFIGYVKFSSAPVGSIVTLYAQVYDEVGNESSLASKAIHIADSITLLTLEMSDRVADVKISDKAMKVEVSDSDRSENIGNN